MKKWTKRVSLTLVALLLGLGIVLLIAWSMLRGTPDWYESPANVSEAERADAANSADQKVMDTLSWAADVQAAELRRRNATTQAAAPKAPDEKTVSFTEAELNACFQKWNKQFAWDKAYSKYLADPVVVLHKGRIILAATLHDISAVASLHFEPKIEPNGRLNIRLARILGGKLPLPDGIIGKYRTKLGETVTQRLPRWQQNARISPDGSSSDAAVYAAMGKLFLNVVNKESSEPVLFLPVNDRAQVPVRVTDVSIEDKTLTLTVQPLTESERADLLNRIKEPQASMASSTD